MSKYKPGDKFILEVTGVDESGSRTLYKIKGLEGLCSENMIDKLSKYDLPEMNVGKMIPCSCDMPPYSDELLLIQCSGKPVPGIIFDDAFALGSYTNEGWIAEEYPEWDSIAVSAWRLLPESYVGEMKCERQQSEPDWKQSMMRTFWGGTT